VYKTRPVRYRAGAGGRFVTELERMDARARYYEEKTEALLRKYGPGPEVHYHVGFANCEVGAEATLDTLSAALVAAQRAVLVDSARAWEMETLRGASLLDVGCGLGGGSIFWAKQFGCRVTAMTDIASHAACVDGFAAQAGVSDRVETLVCDAVNVCGRRFDAAVAIESSCYLPRLAWFQQLSSTLPIGAEVFLIDAFLGQPGVKSEFDEYWHCDIGSLDEYRDAARCAGFETTAVERVNARSIGFWDLSLAWTRAKLACDDIPIHERSRMRHSLLAHKDFRRMYESGEIEHLRLTFQRRGDPIGE
jgi:tocopherol O-methyltransferase